MKRTRGIGTRAAALVTSLFVLAGAMAGCGSSVKSVIGENIGKAEAIDFSASWIKDKKAFIKDEEGWKIGFMGKSVKITSGSVPESAAWYVGSPMADQWVLTTQIIFSGIKGKDSSAEILLASEDREELLSFRMDRQADGQVRATMTALKPSEKVIAQTGYEKTKDSVFDITIFNTSDDGRLQIHVIGENGYSYHVKADAADASVLASVGTFGYRASLPGINFHIIGLNNSPGATGMLQGIALTALNDLYANFWRGPADTGNIMKEDHGYETQGRQTMIWAHAMMLFGMESMYLTTGDEDIKTRITAQWNFTKDNFTEEELTTPGRAPNIAVDDAGWDAMAYMVFYRITGDPYALQITKGVLEKSYDFWKDGSTENGLWYLRNDNPLQSCKWKSIYTTGLMLAALEYYEVTGDEAIYGDTLAIYGWIEQYLLRDQVKQYGDLTVSATDNLYWADFNVDREDRSDVTGPDGATRPDDITEAGSVSFLGGNMAMAVIHAKLYKITGDAKYKERALETVRAIDDGPYNNNGVYLDDRDAWTTAAFAKWWAQEVLPLDGITDADRELLKTTAISISTSARTTKGYYGGSWSGPAEGAGSKWFMAGSKPEQIMTSANACNMIFAAALMDKMMSEGSGN